MIALDIYIFSDATMKENTGSDIEKRLKITFSDRGYIRRLDTSDKRWIDEEIDVVTRGILEFVSKKSHKLNLGVEKNILTKSTRVSIIKIDMCVENIKGGLHHDF